jgi:hypothetical protein
LPRGSSRLWSGPATKPSSEIDMWQVVSGTANLLSDCDLQAVVRTVAASQATHALEKEGGTGVDAELIAAVLRVLAEAT